jgi:hypothetical protein
MTDKPNPEPTAPLQLPANWTDVMPERIRTMVMIRGGGCAERNEAGVTDAAEVVLLPGQPVAG